MADIDFITDLAGSFSISLTDNPGVVTGNRALLNRFEITFMTTRRSFLFNGTSSVVDSHGGDASRFIGMPQVLRDVKSIAASVSFVIEQTVASLKGSELTDTPNNERILSAELLSIDFVDDIVTAKIKVVPVETEYYVDLEFNLPIVRGI